MHSVQERDAQLITEAAAALDTSEIAIFRRAWAHWYGGPADEARIEPPFLIYMFGGPAPHWAREYARRIVEENRAGDIVPQAWGIHSTYVRNPLLGFVLTALAVAVLIALVVAADIAAQYIAGVEGCLTPPCYDVNPRPPAP